MEWDQGEVSETWAVARGKAGRPNGFSTRPPPVRRPPSPASRKRAQAGDLRLPGPAHVFRPPLRAKGCDEPQTPQGKTGAEPLYCF